MECIKHFPLTIYLYNAQTAKFCFFFEPSYTCICYSVLCEFCVYLLRHMISVIELCDKSETSVMNYSRTAEFFTDVCHSS